jgi:hypothetical protein
MGERRFLSASSLSLPSQTSTDSSRHNSAALCRSNKTLPSRHRPFRDKEEILWKSETHLWFNVGDLERRVVLSFDFGFIPDAHGLISRQPTIETLRS